MEFTKPKKIFIVDDDTMLSAALKDFLTRKVPHQVSVFDTGEDCLNHMSENPEVVILDYYLNTVKADAANGMEILKTIKKNFSQPHIIMLSSQESYSTAMQAIHKGAEQYVIKDDAAFEKIAEMIKDI